MPKVRIYDLAKDLDVQPKELLDQLKTIGITNKVPSSSIEETQARSLRQMITNKHNPEAARDMEVAPAAPSPPASFKNFRAPGHKFGGEPGGGPAISPGGEVASDVIEDYRERLEPTAGGPVIQNPARSGPGARRDAGPVSLPGNGASMAPTAPAVGGPPRPAGPPVANGAGAAPVGAVGQTPPGQAPPAPAGRFQGRGGNFRGGGRRDFRRGRDRFETGPRFGDRDFQVETAPSTLPGKHGEKPVLLLPPTVTVAELAEKIHQPAATLIKKLFGMSIIRSANQPIGADVAGQLLAQFGYGMELEKPRTLTDAEAEATGEMVPVPPVVTVMGHVDHGKTSLLDIIRSSNVQRGEAGGITQRIGAYETEHHGERIVFLDTPGHEAFTRMRARGAHVTDIAILVVAADDGVMPQTREAIDHARAAKVPIIVAMNKMDRAEADPNRVKGELAEVGLIPEDYGGETVVIPVSAKTGQGVQDLLDMVLLVAELQELKANPQGLATGTIIEAQQDAQRGPVATVLVHRGTLRVGDHIVVGDVFGRVRAMLDYKGDVLEEAGPKTPVSLTGLSAVPHASDTLRAVASSREARELATKFAEEAKQGRFVGAGRVSLDELFAQVQKGAAKELNIIVKADVQGSVEALVQSLEKLAHDEVRVKIISRGAGNVTESDVMLASASNAIIIAFTVGTEPSAVSLAEREKIEIRTYNVIYDAINEIKGALEGMLEPVFEERLSGEADVRALFKSTRAGTIAGCLVQSGKLIAGSKLRVWRKSQKVYEGKIDSLKHVKQDVKEMVAGQECGVATHGFNDFAEGDILQSIVMESVKRNIEAARPTTAVVGPPARR